MGSVLLFGLAPAIHVARPDARRTLHETATQTTASPSRQRARSTLAAAQCALALMLLVGATLLVRTFQQLNQVNLGFDPDDLLIVRLWMPQPNEPSTGPYFRHEQRLPFFRAVSERIRALPGVEIVSWSTRVPLAGRSNLQSVLIAGRPLEDRNVPIAETQIADPTYFQALGIPLRRGRMFADNDIAAGSPVILVNEAFARRYFPDEEPVGRRLRPGGPRSTAPWRTIVGVVGDVRATAIDRPPAPLVYLSANQFSSLAMAIVVKARGGNPAALGEAIRAEVRRVDPEMPVYGIQPLIDIVDASTGQRRFATTLLLVFSAFALVLACVGVYAVITYLVTQRTHEFGIRMALGARPADVLRIVLGYGSGIAAAGIGVGLAAALLLTRGLSALLFEVSATDTTTFVTVPAALALVTLLACYMPARRAIGIAPLEALRRE
jgi:putative ABC transport system permease protein